MPALLAAAVVFLTSAVILILEILAGRLLAPYVGVTLETFTGIIGVILAGISLGNWLGGRLADIRDPRTIIGPMLALGGTLSVASPLLVDIFAAAPGGASPGRIVLLATVGFFAPATVLSTVSPAVIKLQLSDLDQTGRIVGKLSAISTAGAIAGTFLAGFLLISSVPTRPLIRVLSALLVLGGIGLTVILRRTSLDGFNGSVSAAIITSAALAGMLSLVAPGPCEVESAYFCGRVVVDPDRTNGRILVLDTLRHSYVDLDDPSYLDFTYAQTFSDVMHAVIEDGATPNVLHVGGGGFTFPRYLRHVWPGSTSTVLELDPALVHLAQEQLGLQLGSDIDVVTGDARLTLMSQPGQAFDLVLGDAFGGVSVPWHLTTREFVGEVKSKLKPGGVYVLNLIDYPPLGFARAELATLAEQFKHIAIIAPQARLDGESGGNFVLVASDQPIPIGDILARNALRGDDESAAVDGDALKFIGDGEVLYDDFAPVDQLLTPSS